MFFEQIKTVGLGCYSYAIGCPMEGVMAVIDPRRDIGVYLRIAEEHEMRITHIFETHVHADHISGARALRAETGADICIHESAPVGYEAIKLKNGDEFRFGNAFIRVLHTPGHTPDSVSLLISDLARSKEPEMILTGDMLFVGDIGRPDLPGEQILDEQIENLYNSLYKVAGGMPEYLEVYPAHGEGSLCGQGMSVKPYSTLGYERLANNKLKNLDYAEFKRAILSNIPVRPQSFAGIIKTNLNGASVPQKRNPADYALSVDEISELQRGGAIILDLRDALSFGAAHIPGSINIDFTDGPKLNWVGMAVAPDTAMALVLASDGGFEEICVELQRIGCDNVAGWLSGGFDAWLESGRETQSISYISASALQMRLAGANPPALVDVRTQREFDWVNIKGAVNLPIDRIIAMDTIPVNPNEETVVVCKSGFRAGIAASIMQSKGCGQLSILSGGMNAWQNSTEGR